jgi:hypothetical protein
MRETVTHEKDVLRDGLDRQRLACASCAGTAACKTPKSKSADRRYDPTT